MKKLFLILILPMVLFGGLSDSLQHAWKFENTYNDTVGIDTLDDYNTTFATGIDGRAVAYNGTDAYTIDSVFTFSFSDTNCFSFWINPDFPRSTAVDNIFMGLGYTTSSYLQIYWNDSPLGFRMFDPPVGSDAFIPDTLENRWTHLFARHISSDSIYFYVDGIKRLALRTIGSTNVNWLSMGSRWNAGALSSFYDGKIDEFYFWNRNLSDSEISQLYNSGDGLFYPFEPSILDSLIHQWSFNVDASDTVGSLDGTLEGGANAPVKALGINDSCYYNPTVNGYIDFGNISDLNKFTFSLGTWFCGEDNLTYLFASNPGFGLNNGIRFEVETTGENVYLSSSVTVNDSSWHFIVCTFDSGYAAMYFDGDFIDSCTVDVDSASLSDLSLQMGAGGGTWSYRYIGSIDEPFIFNRALDSCEISSMWNSGAGRFYNYDGVEPCETDSFAIKINGIDLNTISKINGVPIENVAKYNGILLRK